MNFATLPPEITSGRMYEGIGWVTMVEASRAWDRLAIRLCTAAADYRAVTSKLARRGGPAAAATTEAPQAKASGPAPSGKEAAVRQLLQKHPAAMVVLLGLLR